MNTVILGGNLVEDPELRYTGSGTAVANATVATNERYKNREGELVEDVVYHNLVVWENQAEVLAEYADKGQYIVLRGTIQTNEWTDDDGNNRRDQEVKVLEFDFGPRGSNSGGSQEEQSESSSEPQQEQPAGEPDSDTFEPDDELPF